MEEEGNNAILLHALHLHQSHSQLNSHQMNILWLWWFGRLYGRRLGY
jgi:hypothetical protein